MLFAWQMCSNIGVSEWFMRLTSLYRGTSYCNAFVCKMSSRYKIHVSISAVYAEYSTSLLRVFEYNKRYRGGLMSLKNSSRQGQTHRVITIFVFAAMDATTRKGLRCTMEDRIFVGLKNDIRCCLFASKEEVHAWVQLWFCRKPQTFFHRRLAFLSYSQINVLKVLEITFEIINSLLTFHLYFFI